MCLLRKATINYFRYFPGGEIKCFRANVKNEMMIKKIIGQILKAFKIQRFID